MLYEQQKHLSYGRFCRGQVFVYLLQVWLSNFVGKSTCFLIGAAKSHRQAVPHF
jgi:hypothetical protein